jgi:ParB family chromosome partitioning protein
MGDIEREAPINADAAAPGLGLKLMAVSALTPHPTQPRRHFDDAALDELAQSIASRGLIQPIVVRPTARGYQIVAGERRWRAAQRAHLHEVPVIIKEFDDAETLEVALVENIQRQDLNAIEEAEAYHRLVRDYGHSQEALAKIVHKSRSHVANLLRLLELPQGVQQHVIEGRLTMGHARALIGARDVEQLAEQIIAKGLSVRETERLAKGAKPSTSAPAKDGTRTADIASLEHQLADLLGLSVKISFGPKGGSLTLNYSTLDQLDMICQRLSGEKNY